MKSSHRCVLLNPIFNVVYYTSSVLHYGKRVCYAESVDEQTLEAMIRKAFIARFDTDGKILKICEQIDGYIQIDGDFSLEKKGLLQNLKNQIEAVQLADTMEHDRAYMRECVYKYQDEADNAEQTIADLRAMLDVMQMRKDLLNENMLGRCRLSSMLCRMKFMSEMLCFKNILPKILSARN